MVQNVDIQFHFVHKRVSTDIIGLPHAGGSVFAVQGWSLSCILRHLKAQQNLRRGVGVFGFSKLRNTG